MISIGKCLRAHCITTGNKCVPVTQYSTVHWPLLYQLRRFLMVMDTRKIHSLFPISSIDTRIHDNHLNKFVIPCSHESCLVIHMRLNLRESAYYQDVSYKRQRLYNSLSTSTILLRKMVEWLSFIWWISPLPVSFVSCWRGKLSPTTASGWLTESKGSQWWNLSDWSYVINIHTVTEEWYINVKCFIMKSMYNLSITNSGKLFEP